MSDKNPMRLGGGDDMGRVEDALEILANARRNWDGLNHEEKYGTIEEAHYQLEKAVGDR